MRQLALSVSLVLYASACGGKGCGGGASEQSAARSDGLPQELRVPTGEPRELEALRAKQADEGPVNFKQYAPLLPDQLGAFRAAHPFEGLNEQIADGVILATATRQYREGERILIITIADALVNVVTPLLKGGQRGADTPDLGTVKRGEIGRFPALFSWFEGGNESRAYVLVNERVVEVRLVGATHPEEARELARLLNLDELAKVRGQKPEPSPDATTPDATTPTAMTPDASL